ncbi:hypothetical protein KQX54_014363 [Cotesia glomerata]|uniref:Uncharacterized protein n=1 Tax=Cotesia glomerata TaxID=32391 RepID=A0AAV7I5X3_COTGL|nr:hypothetical protein KQX54_014363 [Cotesia glomerata]
MSKEEIELTETLSNFNLGNPDVTAIQKLSSDVEKIMKTLQQNHDAYNRQKNAIEMLQKKLLVKNDDDEEVDKGSDGRRVGPRGREEGGERGGRGGESDRGKGDGCGRGGGRGGGGREGESGHERECNVHVFQKKKK